jgi:hypothetical protein
MAVMGAACIAGFQHSICFKSHIIMAPSCTYSNAQNRLLHSDATNWMMNEVGMQLQWGVRSTGVAAALRSGTSESLLL